ncbi:DNA-binding protein [Bacteroidia bacterium]|nr:DNA-binding protein [Bacteroidia bacterium]
MANEDKVKYWIDLSDEDLKVGRTLLHGGHFLYVAFMCHQAIEKILKAGYLLLKDDTPPYTHKLSYLAQQSGLFEMLSDDQKDYIRAIDPLNIEARYPEYKTEISKSLTHLKCVELLEQAITLQQWIKEKILLAK